MSLRFKNLTRPAIKALPPGKNISEHGIHVSRLANGDLRYAINIMVDGHRIHRVIGRESDGVTREQAERAIEALRTRAREERLDLPTGRKVHRIFAEAAKAYLERIEDHPKHGRNLKCKRRHLLDRLVPHFNQQRLDKLTDAAIAQYVKSRRNDRAAVSTINRELSTLNHFLNRLVEWKWLRADLKPKLAKGPEARKQIVVLDDTDKQALMRAAIADQDPQMWLFVAVAMGTGMRHSEILRIRWEEIDFANLRIYVGKAKAGQREQPIPPSLSQMLRHEHEALGTPTGWLFSTSHASARHEHRQQMSEPFRRVVERAGLDPAKVTLHVLRHTAVTALIKGGVDLPTVQRISGHKTLAMVLRYTHLTNDHVDKSVETLGAALSAAFTPELHTATEEPERDAA